MRSRNLAGLVCLLHLDDPIFHLTTLYPSTQGVLVAALCLNPAEH
jgi:hypothetical protein